MLVLKRSAMEFSEAYFASFLLKDWFSEVVLRLHICDTVWSMLTHPHLPGLIHPYWRVC